MLRTVSPLRARSHSVHASRSPAVDKSELALQRAGVAFSSIAHTASAAAASIGEAECATREQESIVAVQSKAALLAERRVAEVQQSLLKAQDVSRRAEEAFATAHSRLADRLEAERTRSADHRRALESVGRCADEVADQEEGIMMAEKQLVVTQTALDQQRMQLESARRLAQQRRAELEGARAKHDALQRSVDDARVQVDVAQGRLRDVEGQMSTVKSRVVELSGIAAAARDEAEMIRARASDLTSELAAARETLRRRQAEHRAAQEQVAQLTARVRSIETEVNMMEDKMRDLEAQLERHRSEVARRREQLAVLRGELSEAQAKEAGAARLVSESQNAVAQAERLLKETEQSLQRAKDHECDTRAKLSSAEVEGEKMQCEVQMAVVGLGDAEAALRSKQQQLDEARKGVSEAEQRMAEQESEIATIERKIRDLQAAQAEERAAITARRQALRAGQASLVDARSAAERAGEECVRAKEEVRRAELSLTEAESFRRAASQDEDQVSILHQTACNELRAQKAIHRASERELQVCHAREECRRSAAREASLLAHVQGKLTESLHTRHGASLSLSPIPEGGRSRDISPTRSRWSESLLHDPLPYHSSRNISPRNWPSFSSSPSTATPSKLRGH